MRARWKSFKIEFRFQISKQFRNQTLDFEAGVVIAARADTAVAGSRFADDDIHLAHVIGCIFV